MMEKVKNFLKSFSLREWILMLVAAFAIAAAIQIYFSDRTKIVAIQEEISKYKNKADEEYLSKTILIQDVKALKKSNDSLYNEYKKIKGQEPLVITETTFETRVDTLLMETEVVRVSPNEYTFNWSYSEETDTDNYFQVSGHTRTDSLMTEAETYLDNMQLGADLKIDLIKSQADNALRMVARSNNPRVHITNIDGVVLNPSKNEAIKSFFPPKRWGIGIGVGVGTGFDVVTKRVVVGPQVTVGINYNLLNW